MKQLKTILLGIIAVLTLSLTSCVESINVGNVGLKVNKVGGDRGVSSVKYVTGWVWYNPFTQSVIEYSTRTRSVEMEDYPVQAKGGTIFTAHPKYIYNVIPTRADTTYRAFGTDDLEFLEKGILHTIITKAIGDVGSKFVPDSLLANRDAYESEVIKEVQRETNRYGFNITLFRANLTPPQSLTDAISRKQAALQNAQTIENEKLSIIAQGEKDVAKARFDSTASVVAAKAEAEVIRVKQDQLKQSPAYIDLIKAQRWNGVLPSIVTSDNSGLFMQLPNK